MIDSFDSKQCLIFWNEARDEAQQNTVATIMMMATTAASCEST